LNEETMANMNGSIGASAGEVAGDPADRPNAHGAVVVIEPPRRGFSLGLREAWRYRELMWLMLGRQVSSRYRQMLLGAVWALLEPLATLLMLSVVFGFLLRVDSNGYPYAVFAFAGLVPWWLFSRATLAVAGCLQDNMGLISKVYFPRLILAVAAAGREMADSLVALLALLLVSVGFGYLPGPQLLLAPLVLLAVVMLALGVGLWVAAVMVRFRDIRPLLGVVLQAGMYATPILYSASLVPPVAQFLYRLNPMLWAVEAFRWLLLGQAVPVGIELYLATAFSLLLLLSGLQVFAWMERTTVDVQ
jgi:lipopolysaccharide transport system permease protein